MESWEKQQILFFFDKNRTIFLRIHQDGLRRGGSTLLEPILEIHFLIPPECAGRVMSDVIAMRGETLTTQPDEERTRLIALVPAATSPRRNVDPLDESRYILAARSALEGGIFDLD